MRGPPPVSSIPHLAPHLTRRACHDPPPSRRVCRHPWAATRVGAFSPAPALLPPWTRRRLCCRRAAASWRRQRRPPPRHLLRDPPRRWRPRRATTAAAHHGPPRGAVPGRPRRGGDPGGYPGGAPRVGGRSPAPPFIRGRLAAAAAAPISVPFGGPLLGADGRPVGSLLLVEGEALPAVEAALAADPYARAGLFQSVSVRAWRRGMASPPPLPSTLYVVYCVDVAGGKDLRATTRPAHLDWWKASGRAGMIGPFPDGDGAVGTLLVVDGTSTEEVTAWAATDPYAAAGLFESVRVWPMKKVVEEGKVLV
ncbi:hypothetical protein I4F81_004651 [Pyropia yezoensis]|uniref:Uncharacterized protein n=1 Tax=Pyropia yezoensis TaxID=2788 RepID=A0ACC3BW18_PYRYE|nr:hypothetical protein I4F81_004651 [Neopyropia yezoensis]